MTSSLPCHVLLVIDGLCPERSGVYGLARWLARFLSTYSRQHSISLRLTYTSTKLQKDRDGDEKLQRLVDEIDFQVLHPTHLGYARRKNESGLSVSDLTWHDKQYFRNLNDIKNVTHVVLFAPLTQDSCLPGGLVERIKSCSPNYRKPKVILVHQMLFTSANDDSLNSIRGHQFDKTELAEMLPYLDTIASVGDKLYGDTAQIVRDHAINHICLYPTYNEYDMHRKSSSKISNYTILSLFSSFNIMKHREFLKSIAKCASNITNKIKSKSGTGNRLCWLVCCPGLTNHDKNQLLSSLLFECEPGTLNIEINTGINQDVRLLVSDCSLCIQPGDFDIDGFSGLELLLCGIPTLVQKTSDVGFIIKNVDVLYSGYFCLSDHVTGQSALWTGQIEQVLLERQDTDKRTAELADKYRNHQRCVEGLTELLKTFFGRFASLKFCLRPVYLYCFFMV